MTTTHDEVRRAKEALLPVSFLRECLDYDPETGIFRWRVRPESHFPNRLQQRAWNGQWAGKRAGSFEAAGYRFIKISTEDRNLNVKEHRIAWALQTGAWPTQQIDHKNRQRADNRFGNLREVTTIQNSKNTAPGWGAYPSGKTWKSSINSDGIYHWLGCFPSEEEARTAYLAAKARLHV